MAIERSIFFANHRAYNIDDTIQWVYDMHCRFSQTSLPIEKFNTIVSELIDLKFLVTIDHADAIIDLHTNEMRTFSEWFLLYGVIDSTFEYFDGTDASVGTFEVEMCAC